MALEITLLGQVSVTLAHPGVFRSRTLSGVRERVAFALLTLERQRGVTRDAIAEAIWPGDMPPTWQSAVRTVISRIRTSLAIVFPEACGDLLLTHDGQYVIRLPETPLVDVESAERATTAARDALAADAPVEARRLASEALTILRRPFLPDHDSEWVSRVREHLADQLLSALELASQAAVVDGDSSAGLAYADEAVFRAPLRESSHRCRMTAHAAAGNRSEGLRAYHELRRLLADEVGADPAPETDAAYLDLLGPAPRRRPARPVGPSESPATRPPFVGRHTELDALTRAWERTIDGHRQLAVITGEPGIGKTRLVTEAARRAAADGGLVLFGSCDWSSGPPYQPLVEMLDGYLATAPADQLPAPASPAHDALAAVFPSLADRRTKHRRTDQAVLFAAITSLMRQLTSDRAVFAVLDDLQWAGQETLRLVRHLLRQGEDCALLLVVAARNAAGPGRTVTAVSAGLRDRGALHNIDVGPLTEADTLALVRAFDPSPDSWTRSKRLHAETSGNPMLLVELLRADLEMAPTTPSSTITIPTRISEMVCALLERLPSPAIKLVDAASVTQSSFDLDTARRAAVLDERTALDALEELIANGLFVAVNDMRPPHRYRFPHELIRRGIYAKLSGPKRRQLHARWADAIVETESDDSASRRRALADHTAAAASPHGDRRAVHWARTAARDPGGSLAASERIRLYRQALANLPRDDDGLRAEVLLELGLAQVRVDNDESELTLIDSAVLSRRCGRLDITAQAALGFAALARTRPHLCPEARALLHDALSAKRHDPPNRVGDELLRSRLVARLIELGDAVPVSSAELRRVCAALTQHLQALEGPVHIQARDEFARELATVANAADEPAAALHAGHHRAMAAAMLGDGVGVRRELRSMAHIVARHPLVDGALLLSESKVTMAVIEGRFAEAFTTAKAIIGRQIEDAVRSTSGLRPGSLAPAQALIAAWLQHGLGPTSGRIGPFDSESFDDAELLLLDLKHGDHGRARLRARMLATDPTLSSDSDQWAHVVGLLGVAAAELDDRPLATAVRQLLAPYPELVCGAGYRSFAGTAAFHLGRCAAVVGDWAEAERYLSAASRQLAAMHARPWLALVQRSLASVLTGRGRAFDRTWATTFQAEAKIAGHNLGSPPDIALRAVNGNDPIPRHHNQRA